MAIRLIQGLHTHTPSKLAVVRIGIADRSRTTDLVSRTSGLPEFLLSVTHVLLQPLAFALSSFEYLWSSAVYLGGLEDA